MCPPLTAVRYVQGLYDEINRLSTRNFFGQKMAYIILKLGDYFLLHSSVKSHHARFAFNFKLFGVNVCYNA